jgi:hypothetical protein
VNYCAVGKCCHQQYEGLNTWRDVGAHNPKYLQSMKMSNGVGGRPSCHASSKPPDVPFQHQLHTLVSVV